ncbi:hypothetical protein VMCG_10231 [Cytospora schulzeri]|uniref:Uncharacterized protein n=1 Tax=Cytospora schulzeri TaxID=448051 RepID=A0A423VEN1_9PEZI|nr:hypothetical protein VMCG_10231 [Valsa malicola]
MPKLTTGSRRRRGRREVDTDEFASSGSSDDQRVQDQDEDEDEDEDEDDDEGQGQGQGETGSDSDTANDAATLKVKRPSVRFTEKKKALKKAKLGKGDLSDSSTGSSTAVVRTVKLPPLKAKTYGKMTKRGARRLGRAVDRSITRLPRAYSRRTKEDFEKLIPQPIYDDYWTRDDQEALEERASEDQEFTERHLTDSYMLAVWKTVYRFTGRLATDIIGPKTYLEFKSGSVLGKHAKWTPRFCEHLLTIVVHPWFNFSTAKMALAIQWSVICRTDDRRVYRLSGCDDDMFLLELASVAQQEQDGTKTAPELRELACSRHMGKFPDESEPPRWSQFMEFIERYAYPRGKVASARKEKGGQKGKKSRKGKETAHSKVESWNLFASVPDLKAVVVALDRMRHGRIRMFTDADTVAETFKLTRDIYDPPDQELTVKAIKGVFLQVMRNELRSERGGAPELQALPSREERGDIDESSDEGLWEEWPSSNVDVREEDDVIDEDDDDDDDDDEDEVFHSRQRPRKRPAEDDPVEPQPQPAQKRPRGRPPKNPVQMHRSILVGRGRRQTTVNREIDVDIDDEDEDEEVVPTSSRRSQRRPAEDDPVEHQPAQKRPRGRPPKNPHEVSHGQQLQQQLKRGPGRPPKVKNVGKRPTKTLWQPEGGANVAFPVGNVPKRVPPARSVVGDSQSGTDAILDKLGARDDGSIIFEDESLGFDDGGFDLGDDGPPEEVVHPEVAQPDIPQSEVAQTEPSEGISIDEETALREKIKELTSAVSRLQEQAKAQTIPALQRSLMRRVQSMDEELRMTQEALNELQKGSRSSQHETEQDDRQDEGDGAPVIKLCDGNDEAQALSGDVTVTRKGASTLELPDCNMRPTILHGKQEAVAALLGHNEEWDLYALPEWAGE